jgi:hypothetical protein
VHKIAQDIHHIVLKTKFNLKKVIAVENDHNSLWKNMKNDSDDFILQTWKQLDDIENEEKKSREIIKENRIKKAKQMTFEKTTAIVENKVSCDSKIMTIDIQILDMKNRACELVW